MKKGLTLTVLLLVAAAVLAVVGYVQKGELQKKLDAETAKVTELTAQLDSERAGYRARLALLEDAAAAEDKYGLGITTDIGSLADATAEKPGTAQVNTTVCALVLDQDDVIKAVTWDMQQTKVQFSLEGKPVDLPETLKTKLELGADYGMARASEIGKEWNEQIEAFAAWCVGKTVDEVLNIQTVEGDPGHHDVEELKGSVTVSIGGYLAALQKAADNAK
ncbi:MAG: hypothetical protein GXY84_07525 [Clostridiales bacterium]|nr:hypothetical protein [Clostridiales bacterium]